MNLSVKRQPTEEKGQPEYHLFSETGTLLLRADLQGLAASGNADRVIRFVRPDNNLLATMKFVAPPAERENQKRDVDFVLVQDYAVYAIISRHTRPGSEGLGGLDLYYTLEAEGDTWLALPESDPAGAFALYNRVPAGIGTYHRLTELDLPPSVGRVLPGAATGDFQIELPARRWRQANLVLLAFVVLLRVLNRSA